MIHNTLRLNIPHVHVHTNVAELVSGTVKSYIDPGDFKAVIII